jgi:uncharacterized protein YecE (DUF72 family)
MIANAHIGTSGWSYRHWHGPFYPADLPRKRELEFYADHFAAVELNNTFYSLPAADTLADWAQRTPDGFRFSAKLSRYATHMKKLKDPQEPLQRFLDRISVLGPKAGPVLVQLPPNWRFDEPRLADFLDVLDPRYRYAFEFRDPSWFDDRALDLLARHDAALCCYDLAGHTSPRQAITDFVYVRLHGPEPGYQGSYDTATLAGWAGALSTWSRQGRDVYVFFDNDADGHAPLDAARLAGMLS